MASSLQDLLETVQQGLSQVAKLPNLNNYDPHEKQIQFHSSTAKGRLLAGGNRSGKTVSGCTEAIYRMKGEHPYQKVPEPPTQGRIITVDYPKGEQKIIIPQLKQWVPPSLLINGSWEDSYDKRYHTLTLSNGSYAEIMTHDQDLEAFAGVRRHWLWMDEECPKNIYDESKARLIDFGGCWWLTMTPVEGNMTWTYELLYEPNKDKENGRVAVFEVDIRDNPHLDEESVQEYLEDLTEEERKIRGKGEFVSIGGLLLKEFSYKDNVIDPIAAPLTWRWFVSIDVGFRNPTAILWHAISPKGGVYTFKEHYKSEWTVAQHSAMVHAINRELGREPDKYIGDLAMNQKQQETGHSIQIAYRNEGIPVALAKKGRGSVQAGIDKMNEYLRLGKWQISEECSNLLREIKRYKGQDYDTSKAEYKNNKKEDPQKKDDHAIDSCRYMFTFMPDLANPSIKQNVDIMAPVREIMSQQYGARMIPVNLQTARLYPWQYDPNFLGSKAPNQDFLEQGDIL